MYMVASKCQQFILVLNYTMESNNMNEKMKRSYKAHVLVLPFPAQGHINPMLQFCKRLVAKGIKATLANTVAVSKTMIADPGSPIGFDTITDGFDEPGLFALVSADDPGAYLDRFKVVGSETLTSLIRRLDDSGYPVDAVVYDGFLPWALDVAKKFGRVGAVFFTQTCAVNIIYYHIYKGLLPLPLSDLSVLIPGLPPLKPWETPSFVHVYGAYPVFYNMVINQILNIDKADWVLFIAFYESEKEEVDLMKKLWKVGTIGPTLPSMYLDKRLEDDKDYGVNLYKPDSSACMTWLNSKPPNSVIHVSYGSLAEVQAEQMEEVAHCLKDIDYNFLWVVRASEEAKLPAFINKTSEKGLVVTWSPQLEVLSSKSIGCFVTHCGLNSVLEALYLGVVIVAVQLWSDQTTNAKYVEDVWGVGVRARKDGKGIVRREMLGESIRKVMRGERRDEIVKNLVKWKKCWTLKVKWFTPLKLCFSWSKIEATLLGQ